MTKTMDTAQQRPLCVDLDGTLIATDTLWESLFILLRHHPWQIFLLPFWLLEGKAAFKQHIAQYVDVPADALPYRENVLAYLREQRAQGRYIVLATAAHESIAKNVFDHLKLFDAYYASTDTVNLRSEAKYNLLNEKYAGTGFAYMGDSSADIPLFDKLKEFYLVAPSEKLQRSYPDARVFTAPKATWKTWAKAIRMHQWVKNVLIFLPLITSHEFLVLGKVADGVLTFIAFSLTASAGYILNDLLDLTADRHHQSKSKRPFAAGLIPIQYSLPLFFGLLTVSFCIAAFLSPSAVVLLIVYLCTTILYSFYLKTKMVLDVVTLASLFTLRIIIGGVAMNIILSSWILAFSVFLFMSLAFLKRYVELLQLTEHKIKNRDYHRDDLDMISSVGPTSGYLAVLVFSLYIDTPNTQQMYDSPVLLWLISPILLYWITRIWFLARRHQMMDDPVHFALTDRVSWVVVLLMMTMMLLAKFI